MNFDEPLQRLSGRNDVEMMYELRSPWLRFIFTAKILRTSRFNGKKSGSYEKIVHSYTPIDPLNFSEATPKRTVLSV